MATPATLAPVGTGEALTDIAQVPSYPRPKAHRSRTGGHAPERQGREEPRPEPIAVVRPAPDRTIVTRAGGLFYLLNFLKIPAAQAHLEGESTPGLRGGWVWLYRLGTVLGLDADEALMRFLASEAGLDAGRSLAALPGLSSEPDLLRLGETRFGPALWGPGLFPVPAVLRCATTHLDVHFRLGDARLDVRRAGLDTDPGWLPWLGKVVAFHFGHPPELSGEGGAW